MPAKPILAPQDFLCVYTAVLANLKKRYEQKTWKKAKRSLSVAWEGLSREEKRGWIWGPDDPDVKLNTFRLLATIPALASTTVSAVHAELGLQTTLKDLSSVFTTPDLQAPFEAQRKDRSLRCTLKRRQGGNAEGSKKMGEDVKHQQLKEEGTIPSAEGVREGTTVQVCRPTKEQDLQAIPKEPPQTHGAVQTSAHPLSDACSKKTK